ncbi:hypothetical protein [Lentzea californiensis]|uniref:hypothetical protein n=1 Tax=Lentzea californiensis TaxID=438851 RepID=UPI00216532D1|nr:hypothetical protein [Lentzea californiensis]MCR3753674.1 hypothetical protein [Lentzea californiensis]
MNQEVERLARAAAEYRGAGHGLVEVVDFLVEQHPRLREAPFRLALVLRAAFDLPTRELHTITAWVRGEMSRDALEKWFSEAA